MSKLDGPIESRQLKLIQTIARKMGMSDQSVNDECYRLFNRGPQELTRRQASLLIQHLADGCDARIHGH